MFFFVLVRLPQVDVPLRIGLRGALLAAVGFEILKIVGTYTIAASASSATAGPFAGLLAVLIWIQLVTRWMLFCAAWTAEMTNSLVLPEASVPVTRAPAEATRRTALRCRRPPSARHWSGPAQSPERRPPPTGCATAVPTEAFPRWSSLRPSEPTTSGEGADVSPLVARCGPSEPTTAGKRSLSGRRRSPACRAGWPPARSVPSRVTADGTHPSQRPRRAHHDLVPASTQLGEHLLGPNRSSTHDLARMRLARIERTREVRRVERRRVDRLLQVHPAQHVVEQEAQLPLVLLVAARRAEGQRGDAVAQRQAGRQRGARPPSADAACSAARPAATPSAPACRAGSRAPG